MTQDVTVTGGVVLSGAIRLKKTLSDDDQRKVEAASIQLNGLFSKLDDLKAKLRGLDYESEEYADIVEQRLAIKKQIGFVNDERQKIFDSYKFSQDEIYKAIEVRIEKEEEWDKKNSSTGRNVGTGLSRFSGVDGGKTARTGSSRERSKARKRAKAEKDSAIRDSMRSPKGQSSKPGKGKR